MFAHSKPQAPHHLGLSHEEHLRSNDPSGHSPRLEGVIWERTSTSDSPTLEVGYAKAVHDQITTSRRIEIYLVPWADPVFLSASYAKAGDPSIIWLPHLDLDMFQWCVRLSVPVVLGREMPRDTGQWYVHIQALKDIAQRAIFLSNSTHRMEAVVVEEPGHMDSARRSR